MLGQIPAAEIMKSMIPITRFNRGEASRIFDEVASSGTKIVVKNNRPACVLMSPEQYTELMELKERARKQEQEIKRLSELSETQRKFIELAEAAKSGDLTKEHRSQLQRAIDLLKSCLNNWEIDSTIRNLIDASKAVVSGLGSPTFEALKSDHAFRNTKGASNYIGKQLDRLVEESRSLVCVDGK